MIKDFGKLELLENIFGFLKIHHFTPLGFSQQFEAQQSLPEEVFIFQDAGDVVLFSMLRRLSARTKRSGLLWSRWKPCLLRRCPGIFGGS